MVHAERSACEVLVLAAAKQVSTGLGDLTPVILLLMGTEKGLLGSST